MFSLFQPNCLSSSLPYISAQFIALIPPRGPDNSVWCLSPVCTRMFRPVAFELWCWESRCVGRGVLPLWDITRKSTVTLMKFLFVSAWSVLPQASMQVVLRRRRNIFAYCTAPASWAWPKIAPLGQGHGLPNWYWQTLSWSGCYASFLFRSAQDGQFADVRKGLFWGTGFWLLWSGWEKQEHTAKHLHQGHTVQYQH